MSRTNYRSARIPSPRQGAEAGRGACQPTAGNGLKERPILFSAPMVRAILDGRKTQTRRALKFPKWADSDGGVEFSGMNDGPAMLCTDTGCFADVRWPYGAVGDRLWVRETWREREPDQDGNAVEFRADRPEYKTRNDDPCSIPWRPSIYMPRAMSRITLENAGVRVERLQDISVSDARAEGFPADHEEMADRHEAYPIAWYCNLWESINGADSWAANQWVWVVEFKRVTT